MFCAPPRPTANQLLALQGVTPADNPLNHSTTLHWKSDASALWLRSLYHWDQLLSLFKNMPWAKGNLEHAIDLLRGGTSAPALALVREHARQSTLQDEHPDLFRRQDDKIEAAYAAQLKSLTGLCLKDGVFDSQRIDALFENPAGNLQLLSALAELTLLEYSYNAQGLTRLNALKELFKTLIMAITGTPINGPHPYRRYQSDGEPVGGFDAYLKELRQRLECLHTSDAFDLFHFSEHSPKALIGISDYTVVPDSQIHRATLRHYLPPADVEKQDTIIYLSSPLINQVEIFDLADGKSVVQGLLNQGYQVYLVVFGNAGPEENQLDLNFFGKEIHDRYLTLIRQAHPEAPLHVMGYCMGGTLILPYLARRAEERRVQGLPMDIQKVALMAAPVRFDDDTSGHRPMRDLIRDWYDSDLMLDMFGEENIPPQVIEGGMNEIQPGVRYTVTRGFFERATSIAAIEESAPFLNWLFHGTRFPATAHRQWIERIFIGNQIWKGTYRMPSVIPELDGKPVDMHALTEARVCIMDYRGERDPISPMGSCIASETWGCKGSEWITSHGLNRTIEKNIGHIFVVSQKHLGDYMERVIEFYEEPSPPTQESNG